MRILHVLHHSYPEADGYSIRSDALLNGQRDLGWEVAVVTSAQHRDPNGPPPAQQEINGITYYRTSANPPRLPLVREWMLMGALRSRISTAIQEWKPDLLHVHSPVLCAMPALDAAGPLPVVYELRDLWENASVDRGKFAQGSSMYRLAQVLEERAVCRADAVVTICQALRDEISRRCPHLRGLHVVANGVDVDRFQPAPPDPAAQQRWNPERAPLLAYIGAFQAYEGLDTLLRGFMLIRQSLPTARLLMVGSGPEDENLRHLAKELRFPEGAVTFTGRLPHAEVGPVYSIADVLLYPRHLTRTTALTTPLKPLEAMALKKAVLASDVPALRELVHEGENGMVFRAGSPASLAEQSVRLLGDPALRAHLGEGGRRYVETERRWPTLIARYAEVYEPLLAGATRPVSAPARAG
jgi:PEP-CTERM/exosortase A-associated glycosyltransferase